MVRQNPQFGKEIALKAFNGHGNVCNLLAMQKGHSPFDFKVIR